MKIVLLRTPRILSPIIKNAKNIIDELIKQLDAIYVSYKDFEANFVLLMYTKKENPSNVKTKYAINKIASYYEGKEVFGMDGGRDVFVDRLRLFCSCEKHRRTYQKYTQRNDYRNQGGTHRARPDCSRYPSRNRTDSR